MSLGPRQHLIKSKNRMSCVFSSVSQRHVVKPKRPNLQQNCAPCTVMYFIYWIWVQSFLILLNMRVTSRAIVNRAVNLNVITVLNYVFSHSEHFRCFLTSVLFKCFLQSEEVQIDHYLNLKVY